MPDNLPAEEPAAETMRAGKPLCCPICRRQLDSPYINVCDGQLNGKPCGCFLPGSSRSQFLGGKAPRMICWKCKEIMPLLPVGRENAEPLQVGGVLNVPDRCLDHQNCNADLPTTPRKPALVAGWRTVVFWCLPVLYLLGVRLLHVPPVMWINEGENKPWDVDARLILQILLLFGLLVSFISAANDRCCATRRARFQWVNLKALGQFGRRATVLTVLAIFLLAVIWLCAPGSTTGAIFGALGLAIWLPYLVAAFALDRYLPMLGLAAFTAKGRNGARAMHKLDNALVPVLNAVCLFEILIVIGLPLVCFFSHIYGVQTVAKAMDDFPLLAFNALKPIGHFVLIAGEIAGAFLGTGFVVLWSWMTYMQTPFARRRRSAAYKRKCRLAAANRVLGG